jgi:hypothetical protein
MLQIDLRAPHIPSDRKVWRLFPGAEYKFLKPFLELGVGYLDIPGFTFPSETLSEAKDLVARIAASQDMATKAISGAVTEGDIANFENVISDFSDARRTQRRGKLRQAIINFYEEAKKNDLVVIPEPKLNSKLWVGRFIDNDIITAPYMINELDFKIQARRIEWIANYRENMVSSALSDALRTTHPFTLLEKSVFVEVLSLAYGSFVFGERHVSTIYNGQDYLDSDSALLGAISRLSAAACLAIDTGKLGLGDEPLISLLLSSPPIEYSCQQESDIHSPGFTRYISAKTVAIVTAAVVAALIGLGNLDSSAEVKDKIDNLEVINTAPDADPQCNAYVHEATKRILQNLDIDKTLALCQDMRQAAERARLKPSAVPIITPNKAHSTVKKLH